MSPQSSWIERARGFVRSLHGVIRIDRAYLFGSRARGTCHGELSDFDLLLVSPDFEGLLPFERPPKLYRFWDYDVSGLDLLCFTPKEFERERKCASIVADVLGYAIRLDTSPE